MRLMSSTNIRSSLQNPGGFFSRQDSTFIIYPFLFAIHPILFLYVYNISETSANQVCMPMAVSILCTLLLWTLLSIILRSTFKAGLATALFLLSFFYYGHIYELLERWEVFVPKHSVWLPGVLLAWGYCTYFIKISSWGFKNATSILNIIAIVLIGINLFNIAAYEIRTARLLAREVPVQEKTSPVGVADPGTTTLPDIYYIVLDEYTHPDTMAEYYDYDNSQFVESLTNKGFFVALGSRTKEMQTFRSLATSVNMEYIPDTVAKEIVYKKLSNNTVIDFLRSQGYTSIYLQSSKYDIASDTLFNYYESTERGVTTAEFVTTLWNTTMLRPFYNAFAGSQFETYYRRASIYTLDHLKEIPDIGGPKFVFAHIMCPHEPFVFGANGEFVDAANWFNWSDQQFYRNQYIYITQEIEKVIDVLLEKSVEPPIIILQSDHGIRPYHPGIDIGEDEWQKIFNAYYLPGDGKALLWESISPVNSFRVIFNHYFGTNYTLLED